MKASINITLVSSWQGKIRLLISLYVLTLRVNQHSGGELFQRIYDEGKLTEHDAVEIVRAILQGVRYLHAHGVVHRDLKPESLSFLYIFAPTELFHAIDLIFRKKGESEVSRRGISTSIRSDLIQCFHLLACHSRLWNSKTFKVGRRSSYVSSWLAWLRRTLFFAAISLWQTRPPFNRHQRC